LETWTLEYAEETGISARILAEEGEEESHTMTGILGSSWMTGSKTKSRKKRR